VIQSGRFALMMAGLCLVGCGGSVFRYTSVTGQVTYDDGSLVPVQQMVLNFHSQKAPLNGHKYPSTGTVVVDPKTGRFRTGATRQAGGLVIGRHLVTLHLPGRKPLPQHIAAAEYADPSLTPLSVDTDSQPFQIIVKRPRQTAGQKNLSK
jgi:hypothetical protein